MQPCGGCVLWPKYVHSIGQSEEAALANAAPPFRLKLGFQMERRILLEP